MSAKPISGANMLRGGKREYNAKTLESTWEEDRFRPGFEGTRPHHSTETATRQLESTKRSIPLHGTGLISGESKFDDRYDYGNVIQPDKGAPSGGWETVGKSSFRPPGVNRGTEFGTDYTLKVHEAVSSSEARAKYRERWINDNPTAMDRRFKTEAVLSMGSGVDREFKVKLTRPMPGVPRVVQTFRDRLLERGGALGIRAIARMMKIMDDSGDKRLSKGELKTGLTEFGIAFTLDEFEALWRYLDMDESGSIDYEEFLRGVRGGMNSRRADLVAQAFALLERNGDGVVNIEDIKIMYDASFHPDVKSGRKTAEKVMGEFMEMWDTIKKDGIVTLEEFIEYYQDVSVSIDDDEYFELVIRNAWHLPGGDGASAETASMRVLVTKGDGSKAVHRVPNDLGLKRSDKRGIIRRLKEAGIDAVEVSTEF